MPQNAARDRSGAKRVDRILARRNPEIRLIGDQSHGEAIMPFADQAQPRHGRLDREKNTDFPVELHAEVSEKPWLTYWIVRTNCRRCL
jgi:hypothetical protein